MFSDIVGIPVQKELWFVALFLWTIAWKGLVMWKAARKGQRWWFVVFLFVNTLGILEILYYYVFSEGGFKRKPAEPKNG